MQHLLVRMCVAGACALGFVALNQPAKAFSPPTLDDTKPLVIHVQDMEDEAIESDLETGIVQPGTEDEDMSMEPMQEPAEEKKSEEMENEMMDE